MESRYPTARMVARLVGTVISMGLGIGSIGKLHTRMLYSDICKAPFLDEKIKLFNDPLEELLFWNIVLTNIMAGQFGLFHLMLQF